MVFQLFDEIQLLFFGSIFYNDHNVKKNKTMQNNIFFSKFVDAFIHTVTDH